ncbi:hypothetical protein [Variovorax arabinosiphilus]|uniref:hypothetical protein n=1 Tax=Variovorax arabinosiphilus TaxID=3053498 RepID=UPI00257625F6|nr:MULTISPECIES: hypothetical protein [unclassified Variovorax]MDM0122896.1 hypothetical protein [Variovorax sp. J2L1-78]MDM0132108.1 hypothetical protein [Variovorax sp. J2L1-63]MDM0235659.1 hypothetical protein [Variovorax sp. J2R1-6]
MDVLFLFRSIRQLFNRRTRDTAPARSTAQSVVRPPVVPVVAVQASRVEPAQVPVRKMRTLEEVRADLARLRLSASERHARSHAWRDTNFAPTDFMGLANN